MTLSRPDDLISTIDGVQERGKVKVLLKICRELLFVPIKALESLVIPAKGTFFYIKVHTVRNFFKCLLILLIHNSTRLNANG